MPQEPDPTQDVFAQLVRAHRDIEARVAELERASDDPSGSGLDAIARLLAYFDGPAALHHADEDQTLFPRLRPLDGFAQMLGAFDFQHQMNDAAYAELREAFRAAPSKLRGVAHRFAELQRAHIMAEERALFPLAARSLSAEVLARMSDEMAARRRGAP